MPRRRKKTLRKSIKATPVDLVETGKPIQAPRERSSISLQDYELAKQVLELRLDGLSYWDIAARLQISPRRVEEILDSLLGEMKDQLDRLGGKVLTQEVQRMERNFQLLGKLRETLLAKLQDEEERGKVNVKTIESILKVIDREMAVSEKKLRIMGYGTGIVMATEIYAESPDPKVMFAMAIKGVVQTPKAIQSQDPEGFVVDCTKPLDPVKMEEELENALEYTEERGSLGSGEQDVGENRRKAQDSEGSDPAVEGSICEVPPRGD